MFRFLFILFSILLAKSVFSQDITPPDTPVLDSVSVVNPVNGDVRISWFPSDSADVKYYIIYRSISTSWEIIDSVLAPATTYLDTGAAGNFHPELYRIASQDEVRLRSPMTGLGQYHNTMYVFPYQDSANCQMAIRLNWNKYLNWTEGVQEYIVYFSENYGPWTYLSSVPGNTSVYFHETINDNTSYCYFIRAISNNGRTSTSNNTCFFTNLPDFPHFINADYASVVNENRIEVSFTLDTLYNVRKNYNLIRAEGNNGTYIPIATFTNYYSLNLVYFDNIDASKTWCYKLVAYDQCGNYKVESNIARNITLSVTSNEEATETIVWNPYYNWRGGVEKYNIYRIVDDDLPVYAGTTIMDTVFIDDISSYAVNRTGASGKFCYFIEAVEGDLNPYGVKGASKSNMSCSTQFSRVFVPNTFTPNGDVVNAEFIPIVSFVDPTQYELNIFDRWGGKVFETTDPLKGWDGKINGRKVPAGNYVYTLFYTDNSGNKKEKSGYVFLFYP